jgi:hypothetical protein
MWRFVLRENIRRYETLLSRAELESDRDQLRELLRKAELELRELETASTPELARSDAALKLFSEHSVDEAVKLHGAQFSTLQIYDDRRDTLLILAQRNFRAPFLHHLALMKPGDGSACGRCLEEGRTATIGDVSSDPDFGPHREAAREAGFEAVQASPVLSRSGSLIAVLSTYFGSPRRFSEEDLERVERHAQKIGAGLERHLPG